MENNEDLKAQAELIIKQLSEVKTEFIKDKEALQVSIRKDVVATELKAMLQDNVEYYTLKSALEDYINNLLKI